jgi:predicted enzyme related to lactoylglutathione lyase
MSAPIVHIEFSSKDFARTAAFYGGLFGWQTQQNAGASYMKFDGVDGASGGWVRADLVQSPGPVPYLSVDDLASTMEKVEKAGGKVIVRKLPFAGGGEVALVADPDGNVIGLWMRKKSETKDETKSDGKADKTDKIEAKPAPKKEAAGAKPAKPAPKPTPPAERRPAKPAKRK